MITKLEINEFNATARVHFLSNITHMEQMPAWQQELPVPSVFPELQGRASQQIPKLP